MFDKNQYFLLVHFFHNSRKWYYKDMHQGQSSAKSPRAVAGAVEVFVGL